MHPARLETEIILATFWIYRSDWHEPAKQGAAHRRGATGLTRIHPCAAESTGDVAAAAAPTAGPPCAGTVTG